MRRLKPYIIILCINRLDGVDIWAVRYGFRWMVGQSVSVEIPMTTHWRGTKAQQPRAYLKGVGVARTSKGHIAVTAQ